MTKFEALARRADISLAAKGLMLVIYSFRKKGQCRPTRAQLMERTGLAVNTLYARLSELRTVGLLNTHETRDEKGRIRTMLIPFPPLPEYDAPCRNLWGKGLVAIPATRDAISTHARAGEEHTVAEPHAKNGHAAVLRSVAK